MAKCCAHVVGVEMVQSAVNDAKANAEANGNVHYYAAAPPLYIRSGCICIFYRLCSYSMHAALLLTILIPARSFERNIHRWACRGGARRRY